MKFNIITIFPDLISHYCSEAILGRAQKEKIIKVNAVNLRDFTTDKHQKVDDTPYGGGAGMVMKPEPIYRALAHLGGLRELTSSLDHAITESRDAVMQCSSDSVKKTVLLSPRGRQFDQRMAEEWSGLKEITFVCGRYEGVDQRVSDHMVDEEISIGPYVLAGGELGALVIIEAISRLLPGVLGNADSLREETFGRKSLYDHITASLNHAITESRDAVMQCSRDAVIEYPQYTKPVDFNGWKVPEILLSGDHQNINLWRKDCAASPAENS